MPVVEIVPASPVHPEGGVTVQIQLEEVPLLIDTVNCCDPPIVTVGELGLTVTVTAAEVEVGAGEAFPPPPPPQPTITAHTSAPPNRRIPRIPPPPKNNTWKCRNFGLRRILLTAGGIARILSKTLC